MSDHPTVEETFEAKKTFLEGMNTHYPSLDPRLGLLGMKDNGYEYVNEAYGFRLEKIPSNFQVILGQIFVWIIFVLGIVVGASSHG